MVWPVKIIFAGRIRALPPFFSLSSTKGGEGRGENSPKPFSRFEPLQPQDAQVVDNQRGDLEVHGEEAQGFTAQIPSPQPSPRSGGERETEAASRCAPYPAEKLLKEFDAVVIATGATKPRDLPIEGRNLKGVHFAMEFLTANTKSILDGKKNGNFISSAGTGRPFERGATGRRSGCRETAGWAGRPGWWNQLTVQKVDALFTQIDGTQGTSRGSWSMGR